MAHLASSSFPAVDLHIPSDVTVPQFIFDASHPLRLHHYPDAPWIIDSVTGATTAGSELRARTHALARTLSSRYQLNQEQDPIVCVISVNHVDYPTSVWAAHLNGAAVFTTNPAFTAEELELQFNAARPSLFFVQSDVLPTVREAVSACGLPLDRFVLFNSAQSGSDVDADAPPTVQDLVDSGVGSSSFEEFKLQPGEGKTKTAILFPSSGTTGVPKLISVSHYAFIANVLQASAYDAGSGKETIPVARRRYRPGDVALAVLPFFHILGLLINLHHPLFSGMSVVVAPKFSLNGCVQTIEKHQVTHLLMVPPMVVLFSKKLAADAPALAGVRVVSIAGAPLNNDLVKRFSSIIPQAAIGQIYGMTEAGALTAPNLATQLATPGNPSYGASSASVGKLLPGVEYKVISPDGSELGVGEKGELWVRTPSVAAGYSNNKESWSDTFVDGWLRSGDEVYLNAQGEMFVVQRLKDFMKVKGFRVNPEELESQLFKHADVTDCCVVPVPDEFSGEIPKAYVVLSLAARERLERESLEEGGRAAAEQKVKAALMQFVAEHKVTYKHLGYVEFLSEIPKTASGKVLRRLLRGNQHKPAQ